MLKHAIEAKKEALQPMPKYYCKDCNRCSQTGGNIVQGLMTIIRYHCSCFNRRVEPNYNRCFYHSNYSPVHTVYVEPENIVEIAVENELKRIA